MGEGERARGRSGGVGSWGKVGADCRGRGGVQRLKPGLVEFLMLLVIYCLTL